MSGVGTLLHKNGTFNPGIYVIDVAVVFRSVESELQLLPSPPYIGTQDPSNRDEGRARSVLITYEGHPARSFQRLTSPGARDGGPTLAERVARRHGRRLDRVSGQCASSNMSFVRNQEKRSAERARGA